jgi:hypothetical protein
MDPQKIYDDHLESSVNIINIFVVEDLSIVGNFVFSLFLVFIDFWKLHFFRH